MPHEPRRIYLAYGSNLHPNRLQARVGPVECIGTVELPGWSLRFDKRGGDGSAKANLRPAPGLDCAWGALFALSFSQVCVLDHFEGCGRGYEMVLFEIEHDGERRELFSYLAPSHWLTKDLAPFDWYVDLIEAGARFHAFDESYVQQITGRTSRKDPIGDRARAELAGLNLPLRAHYER